MVVNLWSSDPLQACLKDLVDTPATPAGCETWDYAIFWEYSVDVSGQWLLVWGNGYYKGEDNPRICQDLAEQEYRKRVLRELNEITSGAPASDGSVGEEDIADTEWWFLISMTRTFLTGEDFPGQAHMSNTLIWDAGFERLSRSPFNRAKQGSLVGLQTMVSIPVLDGVLELGSTDVIYQSPRLMNRVRVLFRSGPGSGAADSGPGPWPGAVPVPISESESVSVPSLESDLTSMWIDDPNLVEAKKLRKATPPPQPQTLPLLQQLHSLPATTAAATSTVSREVGVVNFLNGQTSQHTVWQMGQMVFNYFNAGVGGGSSFYNTGQNSNGSGTQTTGDVNVHSEYGSIRDVSVKFIN